MQFDSADSDEIASRYAGGLLHTVDGDYRRRTGPNNGQRLIVDGLKTSMDLQLTATISDLQTSRTGEIP